jgi:hypothetical protein
VNSLAVSYAGELARCGVETSIVVPVKARVMSVIVD